MMGFDYMLERREDTFELMAVVETFLKELEKGFRAAVYQEEAYLSFYEDRKQECWETMDAINSRHSRKSVEPN
jgi:hypothetical protein